MIQNNNKIFTYIYKDVREITKGHKYTITLSLFILLSSSFSSPSQHSFTAAVSLYDKGDYKGAIALFEEALVEYYKADVECRALCQGPQRFEGHDHLRYHYSLHELISGKDQNLSRFACIGSAGKNQTLNNSGYDFL